MTCSIGSLKRLLGNRTGWDLIQHLTDTYPGVAKLYGPFGVCFHLFRRIDRNRIDRPFCRTQHRILYVWDPVALRNIVLTEQDIYEEAEWFIKYVSRPPDLVSTVDSNIR